MMGKSALISGTGTGPGPEPEDIETMETIAFSCDPAAIEANWTVGTETNCSSKVFAIASSSSVAGRVAVLEAANWSDSSAGALLTELRLVL
jgi:hypothetical protein